MNSLNLLSGRVTNPKASRSLRRSSYGGIFSPSTATESNEESREALLNEKSADLNLNISIHNIDESVKKTPLPSHKQAFPLHREPRWFAVFKRISIALVDYIQWILSAIRTPCAYLKSILFDENGRFAPLSQICKLFTNLHRSPRQTSTAEVLGLSTSEVDGSLPHGQNFRKITPRKETVTPTIPKASHAHSIESPEFNSDLRDPNTPSRYNQPISSNPSDNNSPSKHLKHNKYFDQSNLRPRKYGSMRPTTQENRNLGSNEVSNIPNSLLKSSITPSLLPTTRFSYSPQPPRPLIPRRQPSYAQSNGRPAQKTLILDLDETLIHSMAKGGRMSTGHMVEVKLNTIIGARCGSTPGPQHPILYWVNKRPYCDEFLRLVYKWYNLVIFTASVQEYADPVIDLLEQERKVFSNRYYRQHCIFKHGAFVKDLSVVEPDLSKVMILDNSPLSYMFHQDNAIPIEGWINDPTDNNLMHLVPLLESLQHVTDVRAFLALRGGERVRHV